ncbi:MAG: OmpH family outer membrane protein [Candidatus Marinimicrobia bacterium]|nr:OmpH family outer membrane protein [Candidatus Neomarinimicrobiota bacterium]MBL7046186.1 OmpH family outer membrane protein [Candidatus Neomarinimicrobiota bacterium]
MEKSTKWWIVAVFIALPAIGFSQQLKVGYIQSDRIQAEFPEFREAQDQLQIEYRKVQAEFESMMTRLDSLKKDYDIKQYMSSPEWLREKEQEISVLEQQVQEFQLRKVGPDGELTKHQMQLEAAIIKKVQDAVNKVAIDKGFDFVFDSIALLYAKPTYNLTDDVLYELRKKVEE